MQEVLAAVSSNGRPVVASVFEDSSVGVEPSAAKSFVESRDVARCDKLPGPSCLVVEDVFGVKSVEIDALDFGDLLDFVRAIGLLMDDHGQVCGSGDLLSHAAG